MLGDAPKVDGTDTVPASFGVIVTEGVGLGVGVAVEISVGVDAGVGVSVGVGGCPKTTITPRSATTETP